MTRFPSLFDSTLTSSFIGFDELFNAIDKAGGPVSGYPVYNIVKHDEDNYSIEIALAGFSKEDIKVVSKENTLTIESDCGCADDCKCEGDCNCEHVTYIHKGIANRSFKRSFTLGEYIEVKDADMVDGILKVSLVRNIPEAKKPKTISIK